MSAILVLRQRSAVHMLTDAAAYDQATGVMHSVDLKKAFVMPSIAAAVSCTGPATLAAFWGYRLPEAFSSFDELVATAEQRLPVLFQEFADEVRGGDAFSTVYIVGWHAVPQRPAAYAMDCWTDASSRIRDVLENSTGAGQSVPERFKLIEQVAAGTPIPPPEMLSAAGWQLPSDLETMRPEIDLLHLMEIQRQEQIEGHHWVGGHARLTTVSRDGISQRVIHTWSEDRVGDVIRPAPIDWSAWRAAHPRHAGLSRLQRDRAEKRTAKLQRRVGR